MSALLCRPWKSRFLLPDSSQCCCSWTLTLNNPAAASNTVTVTIAAPVAAVSTAALSHCCAAALLAFVKTPQWFLQLCPWYKKKTVKTMWSILQLWCSPWLCLSFSCQIATHLVRFCWLAYWPPAVTGPATTSFFVIPVQPVLQEVEGRKGNTWGEWDNLSVVDLFSGMHQDLCLLPSTEKEKRGKEGRREERPLKILW